MSPDKQHECNKGVSTYRNAQRGAFSKTLYTYAHQANMQSCQKQKHNHQQTYSSETSRKRQAIGRTKETFSGM